ncbi:galactose mutarotase-like enzyme [Rivularia sp. PCC 7116]|uniref:aldose epimerase family protein n=1 Tax=Rivularia sp. PCC 7116 TaxID=373994 RepID=UPI00029F3DF1|nr:galactose mutarotase [Rivularia sp. PCC 7116]AFY53045.1 galactose mutarotase-like enzyme [Rivularia sp. PCC 7116]
MFSINVEQRQYETYVITDEKAKSQLEVLPKRGGIATKWLIDGKDVFYMDEERLKNPEMSIRGGNPILFPICGNLPDDTYAINDKKFTLKQHGFARNLPWEVGEEVTVDNVSLKLYLNSNEETKKVYPFDFQASFTYQLHGNTLTILQEFKNQSSEPMPFSVGFHPYFLTHDKSQLELDIPSREYQKKGSQESHPFNGSFDFSQDEIDVAFTELSAKSTSVTDKSRNLKMTLEYDDNFSTLVFWTVKGKDFYCLEPWSGHRNAINTGKHLTVLNPGATHSAMIRLTANFFA